MCIKDVWMSIEEFVWWKEEQWEIQEGEKMRKNRTRRLSGWAGSNSRFFGCGLYC
jgi:hypothetical protein